MALGRDSASQYAAAFLFSVSLGMILVAYPLYATEQGQSGTMAGVLLGFSAAVQVVTRWGLGAIMRLVGQTVVISAAAALMAAAAGLLVVSGSLAALAASAAIQGVARAFFWTGNQVHIVRSSRSTSVGIANLNMMATVAMLVGPVLGGVLAERSSATAFAVAAAVVLAGLVPTLLLDRMPPFDRVGGHGYASLLRHSGVRLGMWASIAVGLWRGLLGSYVVIGLEGHGTSGTAIGVVVAVANASAIAGGYWATRVPGPRVAASTAWWAGVTAVATVPVGFNLNVGVVTALLVAGGVAVGLIQVHAITAVSEAVPPDLRGDAVTLAGVARGLTLSGAPLGVAGLLLVMSLGPAVLAVTVALVAPAVVFSARQAVS